MTVPKESARPSEAPRLSRLAVASLTLGILGLVTFGLLSILGLILGFISVVVVGASGGRVRGQGHALVGIALSVVGLVLFVRVLLPGVSNVRAEWEKAVCMGNLKQIGMAMSLYAGDYDDHFPPTLDVLLPRYVKDELLLHCPSDRSGERSYVYVPGLGVDERPTVIVAFDRRGNHLNGRIVLYVDGHIGWRSEEDFQRCWAEQREEYGHPSLQELGDRPEEEK